MNRAVPVNMLANLNHMPSLTTSGRAMMDLQDRLRLASNGCFRLIRGNRRPIDSNAVAMGRVCLFIVGFTIAQMRSDIDPSRLVGWRSHVLVSSFLLFAA